MDLWSQLQNLDIAMRIAIALACALAGMALLWHDRKRDLAVTLPAVLERKLLPVRPGRPSLAGVPEGPRLTCEDAYGRLRTSVSEATERAKRMNSCQQGASRQLDTAEVALRRLVDEISGVMPAALTTTLIPRRAAPVARSTVRTLAAA